MGEGYIIVIFLCRGLVVAARFPGTVQDTCVISVISVGQWAKALCSAIMLPASFAAHPSRSKKQQPVGQAPCCARGSARKGAQPYSPVEKGMPRRKRIGSGASKLCSSFPKRHAVF